MKSDNPPPAQFSVERADFQRRVPISPECEMQGKLNAFDSSAGIMRSRIIDEIFHTRMTHIPSAVNPLGFKTFIRSPYIFNRQYGYHEALGITESHRLPDAQLPGLFFGNIETNRYGPQCSVAEAHSISYGDVVIARHKSAQRRKCAVHQQFKIR